MNARRWVRQEGPKWVEDGIIEQDQMDDILSLYSKKNENNLLPILGSILIGLGTLTFVAANWGQMSDLFRLILMCLAMVGFYIGGARVYLRTSATIGVALMGIGVITFGAGIFLTSQIFHIVSYTAIPFILWMIVAMLMYVIIPHRFFYYLAFLIGTAGLIYQSATYQTPEITLTLLVLFGVGYLTLRENHSHFYYIYAAAYTISGITFLVGFGLSYMWMVLVFLLLYGVSDIVRLDTIQQSWKNMSILGVITVGYLNVFFLDDFVFYSKDVLPSTVPFLLILFTMLLLVSGLKIQKNKERHWIDLFLFSPLFLFGEIADVLYLLLFFGYSVSLLIQGYHTDSSSRINQGTFLFLFSTLVVYIQIAWAFHSKSAFFFTGGILLFVLSWFLERRRRKWLHNAKGGHL